MLTILGGRRKETPFVMVRGKGNYLHTPKEEDWRKLKKWGREKIQIIYYLKEEDSFRISWRRKRKSLRRRRL